VGSADDLGGDALHLVVRERSAGARGSSVSHWLGYAPSAC
jgi:hypothetical protein